MSASEPRYAVYFAPPAASALWRFGCSVLGLDVETGEAAPLPALRRFDAETWQSITAEPRKYGFHGTLKAPFRLAPGRTVQELDAACSRFAQERARFACAGMAVTAIGRFLALKTVQPCTALDRLAAACVSAFDDFRAPLSEGETERRLRAPLSERQRDHLVRWGYPYVFEDFRFHMTLTGALDEEMRGLAEAELREHFALSGADGSLIVSEIALYRQDEGPFRLIARYPFGA
jgi:putative phosphonate metabolism protein